MIEIKLLPEFTEKVSGYKLLQLEADVSFSETSEKLSKEIEAFAASLASLLEIADINKRPAIAATRTAYKACSKDPNRYRPSQEQLCRRVVRGLGLYTVNAIVDLGNLLSLKTGCALGIFDMAEIKGDELTLGVGREGEPYAGIGRGELNIAGLPVIRDTIGGIGTPTSDNERTRVRETTGRILITIHLFGEEMSVGDIVNEASRLLTEYADARNIEWRLIS